jgi:ABC-type transport system involved in multi-copper enzyme maturation permease subunit
MNVGPVIRRELRAQARQALTHWSRVGAVAVMLAATTLFAMHNDLSPGAGANLLTLLHAGLFFAIWIFVPTLTADCLSRERREGTLSLLFLTHLKPFDIVLAKATAHALRAFMLWIATVPALTLPFLIGGAGWQHATFSVLFTFMALCLALSAGVLASSRCKAWTRAVTSALVLAFAAMLLFFLVNAVIVATVPQYRTGNNIFFKAIPSVFSTEVIIQAVGVAMVAPQIPVFLGRSSAGVNAWLLTETVMALVSLLILWFSLRLAARNVARHWRDEPPSARAQWLERAFCTPILGADLLRRWLRWTLERNPVGWLEQRTWSGRTLMWAWLAVVTSIYVTLFSGIRFTPMTYEGLQTFIAWSLAISLALTAAGSFRRERETGVLELLLVSPTSSWQILSGRVRGLWAQFLPALALLFGVWLFLFTFDNSRPSFGRLFFYATVLLTVPVIGLYFSLAKRGFLSAALWTLAAACLLPVLAGIVIRLLLPTAEAGGGPLPMVLLRGTPMSGVGQLYAFIDFVFIAVRVTARNPRLVELSLVLAALLQLVNAAIYARRLHRNLERRQFALERWTA